MTVYRANNLVSALRLHQVKVNDGDWHHLQLELRSNRNSPEAQYLAIMTFDYGLQQVQWEPGLCQSERAPNFSLLHASPLAAIKGLSNHRLNTRMTTYQYRDQGSIRLYVGGELCISSTIESSSLVQCNIFLPSYPNSVRPFS